MQREMGRAPGKQQSRIGVCPEDRVYSGRFSLDGLAKTRRKQGERSSTYFLGEGCFKFFYDKSASLLCCSKDVDRSFAVKKRELVS